MIYVYVAYIFLFPREKFSVILGSNLRREDFVHYVSTCFKEVGDRVKHWLTVNDPGSFAIYGYAYVALKHLESVHLCLVCSVRTVNHQPSNKL
jgi:hypothetical protein